MQGKILLGILHCKGLAFLLLVQETRHRGVALLRPRLDLRDGALVRGLVGPEAQEPGSVAKAGLLPLVVADLDDELGLHRAPLERDLWAPAARLSTWTPFRVRAEQGLHPLQDLLPAFPSCRGRSHGHELLAVVEAEHEARDPRPLLAPRHSDDHAVGGLLALHLEDAVARAGQVREALALGDDSVEA